MAYNPNMYMPYQSNATQVWGYGQQPINGLVSVTGLDGAKAYPLPANSSMPLFDANEDILYVKTTDGAGFPTVKAYDFKAKELATTPSTDSYVSRAEFDALTKRIDQIITDNTVQPISMHDNKENDDAEQSISTKE